MVLVERLLWELLVQVAGVPSVAEDELAVREHRVVDVLQLGQTSRRAVGRGGLLASGCSPGGYAGAKFTGTCFGYFTSGNHSPEPGSGVRRKTLRVRTVSYRSGYQATLQESHLDKDTLTGERTIVGTVKNMGTETIDLVSVTVNLYNNQGYLIGSLSPRVYYLEPGKTWQFRTDPVHAA